MGEGGRFGFSPADKWDQWVLRRRTPDAPRTEDGTGWVLHPTREYTRSLLVMAAAFFLLGLAGVGGLFFAPPKDRVVSGLVAVLFWIPGTIYLIVWGLAVRRRLHLHEWGVEDPASRVHLRWEELVQVAPVWARGLRLEGPEGRGIELGKYMHGLGRLREFLTTRRPELLFPHRIAPLVVLHPLEFLPPLPGGARDPSIDLHPKIAAAPGSFTFTVEEVKKARPLESSPRTIVVGTVTRGTLRVGDWVAPESGEPPERTWVLVIAGKLSERPEAARGERAKLYLYEDAFPWLKPGALLKGRPPS